LHCAADQAQDGIVEILLRTGAKIDIRDKQNHTPLMFAVDRASSSFGQVKPKGVHERALAVVKRLLEAGANPKAKDHGQQSVYDWADNDKDTIKLLRQYSKS
jgi:ankyrin repeat protein